jgi:hypothetical protein
MPTEQDSTTPPATKEEPTSEFLIGSVEDNELWLDTCPSARTLIAYSFTHAAWLLCALPCKRWGCRWCGPKKIRGLAFKVERAEPNKLITLTVNPKAYLEPRAAYDHTRRKLADLAKVIRKTRGPFEYMRVLEITKKGWPHYHLVARSGYIPQAMISDTWASMTGAPIVDIRQIRKCDKVYAYVIKYLSKQQYIPWTNRRVSWTKHFFKEEIKDPETKWKLINKTRHLEHPAAVAACIMDGRVLTRITPTAFEIEDHYNDTIGKLYISEAGKLNSWLDRSRRAR